MNELTREKSIKLVFKLSKFIGVNSVTKANVTNCVGKVHFLHELVQSSVHKF